MDAFQYKNYDHCIVNLMASIQKFYHVNPSHSTLSIADQIFLKKDFKNVIVMVFDGMGQNILDYHFKRSRFFKKASIYHDSFGHSKYNCCSNDFLFIWFNSY